MLSIYRQTGGVEPPSLGPGIVRVIIHVVYSCSFPDSNNMDDNPNDPRV